MKKQQQHLQKQRLQLRPETIRFLNSKNLKQVVGGSDPSDDTRCESCTSD
jgi:hypothetical protein